MKPVRPRALAQADIAATIAQYRQQGGAELAGRFVAALEQVFGFMAEHPAAGSPRFGEQLDLPGLRHRQLSRFPWLALYWERDDHIAVLRVLDARCDIPAWLAGADAED